MAKLPATSPSSTMRRPGARLKKRKLFRPAIVESSKDAIFAFAPAGTILTCNRGAEQCLAIRRRLSVADLNAGAT